MAKIYEQYKDLHVVSTLVYAYNNKAYSDAAHEHQMKTSELKEAFIKGCMIVVDDDEFAYPIGYAESSNVGSISYIVPNGTTATSADIAALAAVADE